MSGPHDILFKSVFSDPAETGPWLAATLPSSVTSSIDIDAIRPCAGSFVTPELAECHTDLLFEVPWRSGEGELLLYLLFEHQSTVDGQMPLRMLRYVLRIWDAWETRKPGERRFPAVLPIVLYQGPGGWSAPLHVGGLVALPEEARAVLGPHQPELRMWLVDLSTLSDEELRGRALARLVQLLLKHAREGRLADRLVDWVDLLRSVLEESGLRAIERVLHYILYVDDEFPRAEVRRAIEDHIGRQGVEVLMSAAEKLLEQGRLEGWEKGREEGREEGQRVLLAKLATRRFGPLPEDARSRIASASAQAIEAATDVLFVAQSLDELLDALEPLPDA